MKVTKSQSHWLLFIVGVIMMLACYWMGFDAGSKARRESADTLEVNYV